MCRAGYGAVLPRDRVGAGSCAGYGLYGCGGASGTYPAGRTIRYGLCAAAPIHGRHAPAVAGQALVTTETVTLTTDQPRMGADASSVPSHTRNWPVVPVTPVPGRLFHSVGRVSGNGLDTALRDEDDDFRAQMRAGKLSASPRGVLDDVIALQETDADLPQSDDTATGNTSQIERELTSDLPHASRP